jgi:hypothetical protein
MGVGCRLSFFFLTFLTFGLARVWACETQAFDDSRSSILYDFRSEDGHFCAASSGSNDLILVIELSDSPIRSSLIELVRGFLDEALSRVEDQKDLAKWRTLRALLITSLSERRSIIRLFFKPRQSSSWSSYLLRRVDEPVLVSERRYEVRISLPKDP